jgi:hypothetical protein
MAATPYTGVPTTEPQPAAPPFQRIETPHAEANMFGAQVGQGLEQLGAGFQRASVVFGEVAADDASNQYQEKTNAIMFGVPGKMVLGPDGKTMVPDSGFMGLKGDAALRARPEVQKQLEQARNEIRNGLMTGPQLLRYDDFSRRHKTWVEDRVGQHADTQANAWYDQVENASAAIAQKQIAVNANDPQAVLEGRERLREALVKKAQRMGGGPELIQAAVNKADMLAVEAQASAIAATNPQAARRIIENNKDALGVHYDEMMNRVRVRAETADGRDWADEKLTGGDFDNNTGNITRSGFNYSGGKGAPRGNFETFKTAEHGVAAAYQTMQAKARDNGGQISFIDLIAGNIDRGGKVRGWAAAPKTAADQANPMLKGNNPEAYAKTLADAVGLKPTDNIPLGDADKMAAILKAQNKLEKGRQTVPDDAYKGGIVLASGGSLQHAPPLPRTQNDLIQDALNDPDLNDKPHAQAAAIARINQSFRAQNAREAKTKAAFQQIEDDTVAAATKTGELLPNSPTERDYQQHYGPENGTAKYVDFQEKVKAGQAWHSLQDMPDAEQRAYLADRANKLDPVAPGFARAQKFQEHLEKMVETLQKTRREDPAQAVARNSAVAEATTQVDQKDPQTVRNLGQVRMKAQGQFGIEGDARSPITKAEALKIMNPVIMALPGAKQEALEKVAADLRSVYGEEMSIPAFIYGLRAIHISGAAAESAGGVLEDLARGRPITSADRDAARDAAQGKVIQDALEAKPDYSGWTQNWMLSPGETLAGSPQVPVEGPKPRGITAVPSDEALRMLRDNPSTASQFDEAYGPGKAKEVMEQFPWYFQKRPSNGR